MDDPPRRSLEVEPARVGHRQASFPPLLLGVLAVAFVAVAVVKPWDGDAAASGRPSAAAALTPPGPTAGRPGPSVSPGPTPSVIRLGGEDLLAATSPRSSWGIRAVVLPPGPAGSLEERWTEIDDPGYRTDADTRTVAASGPVAAEGDTVVALGITTPGDALPLDVRIWRLDTGGIPRRVPAGSVTGPDPGSRLWRPVTSAGVAGAPWPPGTYRIDALLGRSIDRIVVVVPGDPGLDEPGDQAAAALPPSLAQELAFGEGLFVVADGRAIMVDALSAPEARLGEREAWLSPGLDLPSWAVGQVTSDAVAGVGVVLPPGAVPTSLVLDLVSPIDAGVVAPTDELPIPDGTGRTAILAHTGGERPFAAGTYRVWATWRTADGEPGSSVRYLEIVPRGTIVSPGSPLDRLREWSQLATLPGGLAGEPIVTDADLRPGRMRGTCGGQALVTGSTPLVGLLLPDPDRVVDIRLTAPDGYTRIETRAMLPVDDGLALLALPSGGLIPAVYRIDVIRTVPGGALAPEPDTRGTGYDVCIG
ncbi:MAG: hypothetical protein AB1627_03725 [Chloroflexota bacterium]